MVLGTATICIRRVYVLDVHSVSCLHLFVVMRLYYWVGSKLVDLTGCETSPMNPLLRLVLNLVLGGLNLWFYHTEHRGISLFVGVGLLLFAVKNVVDLCK